MHVYLIVNFSQTAAASQFDYTAAAPFSIIYVEGGELSNTFFDYSDKSAFRNLQYIFSIPIYFYRAKRQVVDIRMSGAGIRFGVNWQRANPISGACH